MTRITNADQILALLRAHLDRAERARASSNKAPPRERSDAGPVERLRTAAAASDMTDDQLDRALIGALLAEQLGPNVAASPAFHTLVSEVATIIERDSETKKLLAAARQQFLTKD